MGWRYLAVFDKYIKNNACDAIRKGWLASHHSCDVLVFNGFCNFMAN